MRVAMLGPLRVHTADGDPITLGGVRLRLLLARLALDAPRPVPATVLVADLWGVESPADPANALQSLVSRLRKALAGQAELDADGGGYLLRIGREDLDTHRFDTLAARGRRALTAGDYARADQLLGEALELWRGPPFADLADAAFVQGPAARLAELRLSALEDLFDVRLRQGRQAEVLADIGDAVTEHPLRERLAALYLRALALAGKQSEALAAYERIRAALAEELGIDPSAELAETHLAVLRGELTAPSPPAQPAADHLPARLTSFVAREEELSQVAERLASSRLLTLIGPGGSGKTRLATEVAARHPAYQHGRVWFVSLAGVRDGNAVPGAVLSALGQAETRALDTTSLAAPDQVARIAEALSLGRSLLVLDNCEHLIEAVALFTHDLLGRSDGVRILATSREPLAITGETLYPVGPLEVPPERADPAGYGAVRLFVDRARAVRPGFELSQATEAVAEICRRLDGMPLALELAAARLRSMTAAQVAGRLDDRFRLLTSGSRAALPRQRTLRAVIEWSWDLMDERERLLGARLSLFSGGASLSAVQAVCADERLAEEDVLYVLGSLTEKSIVETSGSEAGEPRYRMLETLRAYGAERLAEAGETGTIARRFAWHFLAVAEDADPKLRDARQLAAIGTLRAEHDNLLTALRWAVDNEEGEVAYRLTAALVWHWVMQGSYRQLGTFGAELVRLSDLIPDHARAAFRVLHHLAAIAPGFDRDTDLSPLLAECERTGAFERYAFLVIMLPMAAFVIGDAEAADRELNRGLSSADPWQVAAAHWAHGFLLAHRGDQAGAEHAQRAALAGFEAVGDKGGASMTLHMLGRARSLAGDHTSAIAAYQRGITLVRELYAEDEAWQYTMQLALERMRAGDLDGAWKDMREAERAAQAGDNQQLNLMLLLHKLELSVDSGDLAQARILLEQLAHSLDESSFVKEIGLEWMRLAETQLAVAEQDQATARARLTDLFASALGRGDLPSVANGTEMLACVCALEGDAERAATMLGVSAAVRGVFDRGNPRLRRLGAELAAALGEAAYTEAYDRGARLSTADATTLLSEEFGL
ncbi:ATP-binding protein [Amycolatopsis cihanbeyliensis]|uniref:ATP-binding protein n=1 Tax=Amycolatopsis cihanbeyliensis TaxID=1128664 RepID=UPI00115332DF|nr:BTAD domain-containing putative transcriptional regulator [Amycolatopsis cihanbeyliensis]